MAAKSSQARKAGVKKLQKSAARKKAQSKAVKPKGGFKGGRGGNASRRGF